jgi:cyclopropane fatty-acyl-phospholipid synthase-like methyltransferase
MAVHLPYFDVLLRRLEQHHPLIEGAYGRHVHWGYWAEPARARQTPADYAQAAEALAREICRAAQVADGQHILDVGCGFGGTIASLNENFANLDLTGINIDERQLQRARRTVHAAPGNRIQFQQGDACALPLAGGAYERVLAVECIFHFPERRRFFAEAFRVLKPGGYLALSDFVPQGWYAPIAGISTGSRIMRQVFGHCALCTLRGYRRLARDSGFAGVLERDVTAHTLPTYAFMRALAAQLGGRAWDSTNLATRGIELISRIGALRYTILAFRKPL